jgi:hypothetical protein
LFELPVVHHGHTVPEGHGFALIVGDIEEGGADLLVNLDELNQHPLTQFQIEGGEGLIEEEELRFVDKGTSDRHALFLTTTDLPRFFPGVIVELGQIEHAVDFSGNFGGCAPGDTEAESNVFSDREMGKQRVVLKDGINRPKTRRNRRGILSVDQNLAFVGLQKPGQHPKQGSLTAATGTKQRKHLTLIECQGDVLRRRSPDRTFWWYSAAQ